MEIEAELGDRAELDGEPEERQERVSLVVPFSFLGVFFGAFVGAGERRALELAVFAVQRFDACDMEFDLARIDQCAHLVDAVLGGAESIAVMDWKGEWLPAMGARLSVQSSAESPPPATRIFLPRNVSILRTA